MSWWQPFITVVFDCLRYWRLPADTLWIFGEGPVRKLIYPLPFRRAVIPVREGENQHVSTAPIGGGLRKPTVWHAGVPPGRFRALKSHRCAMRCAPEQRSAGYPVETRYDARYDPEPGRAPERADRTPGVGRRGPGGRDPCRTGPGWRHAAASRLRSKAGRRTCRQFVYKTPVGGRQNARRVRSGQSEGAASSSGPED